MRALIVDDEPIARKVLREELEALSVEVAGEAQNGEAALLQIASARPDVVFLDIQMPVMGGFEMLASLSGDKLPAIVMLTAYDQHAIRAFEAGAIDYLLKPVRQQRLQTTIERIRQMTQHPEQAMQTVAQLQQLATEQTKPAAIRKVVGKLGHEFFLLSTSDICAFQADGDSTWIITARQKYLATQNLRGIERRLPGNSFRRIHRNALVNVEHIRKMAMITSQRWLLTLNNGQEFVVSKRQARNVRDVLAW